jgi:hypothetical protein
MSWVVPLATILAAGAGVGGTVVSGVNAKKAREAEKERQQQLQNAALAEERKLELEGDRADRLRRRRSAGTGLKATLLGGAEQGEVGRNILLGQ